MSTDKLCIEEYRRQIQKRFMLGDEAGKLRQRDFEFLSDTIEQHSGVRLSISTLKRLWRDDVAQMPHPSTLNALVAVLGYGSWADFRKSNSALFASGPAATPSASDAGKRRVWMALTIGAVLIVVIFLALAGIDRPGRKGTLVLPEKITFSANKTVTTGVPNTVEFRYDVSKIAADSFFIQQSWDRRNRVAIDPDKNYLSSTYYFPGFHRAKLIVNDSIVATSRIHIKTDGWFSLVEYNDGKRTPIYLDSTGVTRDGMWHVTREMLASRGIDGSEPYQLRFFNIREFENITSDNFSLQASIRSDRIKNVACPFVQIVVVTEENIFFLQTSSKGCIGELGLKFGETYQSARDTDLSGLGKNLYAWQTLRIDNTNKHVRISANDTLVHTIQYRENFGKIVGIVFWFNSPGAIDDIQLWNDKAETIYQESF